MPQTTKKDSKETEARKRLKQKVDSIVRISTISISLRKVLEVIEDEFATPHDLVKAIEHDQALASRIVSMANSAFYGYSRDVTNIKTAVTILGFNMVRNLTISTSLFKLNGNHGTNANKLRDLWKHSYEVAVTSACIAERTGLIKKDEAFLAGLITDIGRVILYQIYGEVYMKICNYGREGLLIREEEAFGADHQQVGSWFLDHYKFPKEMVVCQQNHHHPEKHLSDYHAGTMLMIPVVYIANIITSDGREGFEYDLTKSSSHDDIMTAIYFDDAGITEMKEVLANMEDSLNSFYAA